VHLFGAVCALVLFLPRWRHGHHDVVGLNFCCSYWRERSGFGAKPDFLLADRKQGGQGSHGGLFGSVAFCNTVGRRPVATIKLYDSGQMSARLGVSTDLCCICNVAILTVAKGAAAVLAVTCRNC
jgi:hypothetical protein